MVLAKPWRQMDAMNRQNDKRESGGGAQTGATNLRFIFLSLGGASFDSLWLHPKAIWARTIALLAH